jgi:hypothetical protein
MVSPNDHVAMNHQNQTPNKWHMRPCSLHNDSAFNRNLNRDRYYLRRINRDIQVHPFSRLLTYISRPPPPAQVPNSH